MANSRALQAVSTALDQLARSGTVSNQSLDRVIGSLRGLGPAGAAASIALGILQGKMEALEQEGVSQIAGAFDHFGSVLDANIAMQNRAAGASGDLRKKLLEVGAAEAEVSVKSAENARLLKDADEQTKQNLTTWNLFKLGMDGVADATKGLATDTRDQLIENARAIIAANDRRAKLEEEAQALSHLARVERERTQTMVVRSLLEAHITENEMTAALVSHAQKDRELEHDQEELNYLKQKLILEAEAGKFEGENGQKALAAELDQIDALDQHIHVLERQISVLDELGAMADQAIGQVAVGAFDALEAAIDKTISINNLLSDSTGRAMRNVLAAVLKSVGEEAAVQSLMELAKGIAASVTPGMQEFAAGHFTASAVFAAAAAAAGVGSAAVSVNPGGSGGGGGGGRGGGGSGGDGTTVIQQITVIGTLDDADAADLAQQLARARQQQDLDV